MKQMTGVWNWPETMVLLRLVMQGKSNNQIAAALGRAPSSIKIRVEDLSARYPDVMARIKEPLETNAELIPANQKNPILTKRPNGNAQV
jgi:FixJ family two-component response regulator